MNKLIKNEELVFIKKGIPFTNSKLIAELACIKHHAIQQLIDNYKDDFEEFGKLKVAFEMRPSKTNQKEKIYLLNEEQATLLLTYSKNTEKVREFKKNLVKEFYKAKQLLLEMSTPEFQQLRLTAKTSTETLHETINDKFIPYAIENGSKTYKNNPELAYTHFEKPINKALGIAGKQRCYLDKKGQTILDLMNNSIICVIDELIETGIDYHDIVNTAKCKINQLYEIFHTI